MTILQGVDENWDDLTSPLTSNRHDVTQAYSLLPSNFSKAQKRGTPFPKKTSSHNNRSKINRSINIVSPFPANKRGNKSNRFGEEATPLVPNDSLENSLDPSHQLYLNVPRRRSLHASLQAQDPISTVRKKKIASKINFTKYSQKNHQHHDTRPQTYSIFTYGCCCCQCVRTQEVGIIEHFGRFQEILYQPGCYCLPWPFTDIPGRLSLRVQQLDIKCETKTKDNVFVHISVAIHYHVIAEKTYDAYYRLTDPRTQIESYVYDVIRSTVPRMELDELFISKNKIASEVRKMLYLFMKEFGYSILDTLVVDISPDDKVKASMNAINASKRLKEALLHKAESEKIIKVKDAEARCEAMYLSGIGISNERKAISKGLITSMETLMSASDDIEPSDVMSILLLSQYFDCMSSIGSDDLIFSHSPDVLDDLKGQMK